MIFVTLGTQDKPFDRLLKTIEKEIIAGNIKTKVIVQAGTTKYDSEYMEVKDFFDTKEFDNYVEKCELLITHGGVGSIFTGLKKGKTVIAAARLAKYGEHDNDHQLQVIEKFEADGYILVLRDFNKLDKVLEKAKKFVPKTLETGKSRMINILEEYIDSL